MTMSAQVLDTYSLVKYMSPSSLMQFEGQPYTFYTQRLLKIKERDPQGLAAGMGSSFDAQIKVMLCNMRNIDLGLIHQRVKDSCYNEEERKAIEGMSAKDCMYHLSVEPHNRELVRMDGMQLAMQYMQSNTCINTNFVDFERHVWFDLWYSGVKIPLFMKLDAVVSDLSGQTQGVPLDWKVTGYGSANGASPAQGYENIESLDTYAFGGHHDAYYTNIPMDLIDVKWASQLATYGWGIGWEIGKPFTSVIHCLCWRKTGWRVARFYGIITSEFQHRLASRYVMAWKAIHSGAFVRGLAAKDPDVACMLARAESWY